jgi:tripartite-type tricarboxylate transporter receptor subunit TctC
MTKSAACALLVWAASAMWTGTCAAAAPSPGDYPNRPIRLVVPSAPGGTPDIISRVVGAELTRQMGQQVVVDNRPGANGAIGLYILARSPADGYTIGYGPVSAVAVNPSVTKLQYDPQKDIQPVVQLVYGMHILTVNPSLPIKSVQDLVDHAKANPNKLSFGSSGSGSTQHVGMEMFKMMTGTQMVHVPYKAIQTAITEVIAGRVQLTFDNLASMTPHVKAGRVRALGVTGLRRAPAVPDLPTIAEAGVPGFEVTTWSGVVVPSGVPRPIIERLNSEVNTALVSASAKEKLGSLGYDLVGGSTEQFTKLVRSEIAKWADVVKRTGAKLD